MRRSVIVRGLTQPFACDFPRDIGLVISTDGELNLLSRPTLPGLLHAGDVHSILSNKLKNTTDLLAVCRLELVSRLYFTFLADPT